MCGIAGIVGSAASEAPIGPMVETLRHRGPDAAGRYVRPGVVALGHTRLSILDLSDAGIQPMANRDGTLRIVFNGEIYNYLELRSELGSVRFETGTDTEVLLAAYERWGAACLDRLVGMFAFAIWDERERRLFAARDRFGVKPLYFATLADGSLVFASEIKALHAAGVRRAPEETVWADYLALGLTDHSHRTFWRGVESLRPGSTLEWRDGRTLVRTWYDLAERSGEPLDGSDLDDVAFAYRSLLEESVRLRFRSDVPVGVDLSGGLDSSVLLALVHELERAESDVRVFTFTTGDARYDELPWVERMLERTGHPLTVVELNPADVPSLAASVAAVEDEPYGGLPTLAYARLFERARALGVPVLLDGQGMDEQWAGYDYYARQGEAPIVQGTRDAPVRPECLVPEFAALAADVRFPEPFPDRLRNLQYRDARFTKLPRALRFNDRASMRSSVELREPFLDHRLVEMALRQPLERKIRGGTSKWMLRRLARTLAPAAVAEPPKRSVQTPQREWLRGPLRGWADDLIETALAGPAAGWLDGARVRAAWRTFQAGEGTNAFFVWQWVSLGLEGRHAEVYV